MEIGLMTREVPDCRKTGAHNIVRKPGISCVLHTTSWVTLEQVTPHLWDPISLYIPTIVKMKGNAREHLAQCQAQDCCLKS